MSRIRLFTIAACTFVVCTLSFAPPASAQQGTSPAQNEQDPNRTVTFTTLLTGAARQINGTTRLSRNIDRVGGRDGGLLAGRAPTDPLRATYRVLALEPSGCVRSGRVLLDALRTCVDGPG
jgi:hypothetical protein